MGAEGKMVPRGALKSIRKGRDGARKHNVGTLTRRAHRKEKLVGKRQDKVWREGFVEVDHKEREKDEGEGEGVGEAGDYDGGLGEVGLGREQVGGGAGSEPGSCMLVSQSIADDGEREGLEREDEAEEGQQEQEDVEEDACGLEEPGQAHHSAGAQHGVASASSKSGGKSQLPPGGQRHKRKPVGGSRTMAENGEEEPPWTSEGDRAEHLLCPKKKKGRKHGHVEKEDELGTEDISVASKDLAAAEELGPSTQQHCNTDNQTPVDDNQEPLVEREKKKVVKVSAKQTKTKHKTGFCYLSRIPPHMKPLKLRHLLSQYAAIGRIYLAPEDPSIRLRRKQSGGNTGKNFTEGWVEFERKRDAKRVAELLNGELIGGGHRCAYKWDLWNIKYLHGFKWHNLTEEVAYRNAVREQKLAAELRAAAKERDFYLQQVNKSKGLRAMEEKRKKRERATTGEAVMDPGTSRSSKGKPPTIKRAFMQRPAVGAPGKDQPSLLPNNILAKIFG